MNIIVSVDEKWGIGKDGQLLARVPADMRWFRQHTLGKVVVMGDVTLATLPGGQPLPERQNIILSNDKQLIVPGAEVYHSLPQLLAGLIRYPSQDVFVIGGATVYQLLLPYCRLAYVTHFQASFDADRWFPNLTHHPDWQLKQRQPEQQHQDLRFYFATYENKALADKAAADD